ncbi:ABC-2 type transport system permease protein [Amycolatopsis bartoniae]|uniref:ABC transporter permease n=1 Tax=Amycolatopsis bartoniae TaxID=941986 RepID=A0A8H9IS43_9PSEU|nr:ABC transporter permease [Amycolatopsis bartoniae]MBB2937017.1 ABC-2 type transport system permease protein [Amycolatopsis bartoniae]TVT06402.1 ABC transporter permease [Amycolatopsis bartoniae]GHF51850.1 ABC transporter permease [Amycolatopsis bartoniae]
MTNGTWDAIGLVASREIGTRLRSKAFLVSTAVLIVLLIAFTVLMKFVTAGGGSEATIGYTPPNAALAAPLQASAKALGHDVATREVPDDTAGRDQVRDGGLDALLVGDGTRVRVVVKEQADADLRAALNVVADRLALDQQIDRLGGDPAQVEAAVAGASVDVEALQPPKQYNGQQLVLGILAGVLIYVSLVLNGQTVAQGVVEEKTSRVVELLLATIRPWQLMAGKVLGIGAVGLAQILAIAVVGLVSGLATGVLTIAVSAAAGMIVWLIVWYLLGFLMYSIVFAGLGALVSRQEEVGGAVAPALIFIIAGYVVGISVLPSDPGNRLAEILSVLPFFAPTLMPMRLGLGGVPAWEAVVSVLLVVALIPALIWLSGRIYRNAVLRTGAKVKLREALSAA